MYRRYSRQRVFLQTAVILVLAYSTPWPEQGLNPADRGLAFDEMAAAAVGLVRPNDLGPPLALQQMADVSGVIYEPATIDVTLLTPEWAPVPDTPVQLSPSPHFRQPTGPTPSQTDSQGRVTFTGLPPGCYRAEGARGRTESSYIIVGPGDTTDVNVFSLPVSHVPAYALPSGVGEASPLRGRLQTADGQPVPGAFVYLDVCAFGFYFGDSRPMGPIVTDVAGLFEFEDVEPGYHLLIVSLDDGPAGLVPFYVPSGVARFPFIVTLPERFGGLQGEVIDGLSSEPVPAAQVIAVQRLQLHPRQPVYWREVYVDPRTGELASGIKPPEWMPDWRLRDIAAIAKVGRDGWYAFHLLLPGEYLVIVLTPDGCRAESRGIIVEPGTITKLPALRLYARDAFKLTARLLTTDPALLNGRNAAIYPICSSHGSGLNDQPRMDAEGNLSASAQQPGWYALSIRHPSLEPIGYWGAIVRTDGVPAPFDVTARAPSDERGQAILRMRLPTGEPSAAPVWAIPLRRKAEVGYQLEAVYDMVRKADEQATCVFDGLPVGAYRFLARTSTGKDAALRRALRGTTDEVNVLTGETTELTLTLEAEGRISGRVVDAADRPVRGLLVLATRGLSQREVVSLRAVSMSDANGEFALECLEPGYWSLCGISPSDRALVRFETKEINLRPGEQAAIQLKVTEAQARAFMRMRTFQTRSR